MGNISIYGLKYYVFQVRRDEISESISEYTVKLVKISSVLAEVGLLAVHISLMNHLLPMAVVAPEGVPAVVPLPVVRLRFPSLLYWVRMVALLHLLFQ